ncbi:trypsin-like peptidase domain-containing protein [Phaeobacter sp. B1627]|uniref:trypsin-like peptidase domain-containing protein n=1 Tax=Phaeobacter sp. B1627 TaxID=2583809 RepID=UPI00111ADA94|nr:trypsin-like peptidase domain-containing protein [Phaeobacter sp. B1627]TNJ41985.1 peptidoglycan-binding protein [Phaeobacter sp. B1627]
MKNLITSVFLALTVFFAALPGLSRAQQSDPAGVWIQVAARPSLLEAQDEARALSARLPDVAGYALGGGWYGIVIGPYTRPDAEQVLRVYRAEGQIPRDSFITFSSNLNTRFYPVGPEAASPSAPPVPVQSDTTAQTAAAAAGATAGAQTETAPVSTLPDETPAEARRSEQALSRDARMDLQVALKAAGFYTSAIDGAFGRGTRGSMADWQTARGYEATGVLTTLQRQALMDEYNAPLISVGMATYTDTRAGISVDLPQKEVAFSRYEPPFAHFDATGDLGVQVLLISQPGDRRTLYGLYDIMQTLEIVPLDGDRERSGDRFTLEGRNSRIVSYTEARLDNGEIKGFSLIWPAGDEARRSRVLAAMQASFARLDGVLDPTAGGDEAQSIDLVSGLEIRKPRLSRSGFFVTSTGVVVTTADAVLDCGQVTIDRDVTAEVLLADEAAGIAVLKPSVALSPMATAPLAATAPRLRSALAVSGYSYGGVLGAPSLTWGSLDDLKGLQGEAHLARLELTAQPGDAGGPLLDKQGTVHGMLLPLQSSGPVLPEGVRFALKGELIRMALDKAGVGLPTTGTATSGDLPISVLQKEATGLTTLVSCWE